VTLLARVVTTLSQRQIAHCLVGAAALAVHGISRSTHDIDLLVADDSALADATWAGLRAAGVSVEVHRGDAEDPLAGVVRFEAAEERAVDVIVARAAWQRALIGRARSLHLVDLDLPVADAADLVLLKLYAGGPQDQWDVHQLLETTEAPRIVADVDARVAALAAEPRRLWQRLRPGPRGSV
jgi:hypothetical protein